jgi:hypothetical protein
MLNLFRDHPLVWGSRRGAFSAALRVRWKSAGMSRVLFDNLVVSPCEAAFGSWRRALVGSACRGPVSIAYADRLLSNIPSKLLVAKTAASCVSRSRGGGCHSRTRRVIPCERGVSLVKGAYPLWSRWRRACGASGRGPFATADILVNRLLKGAVGRETGPSENHCRGLVGQCAVRGVTDLPIRVCVRFSGAR